MWKWKWIVKSPLLIKQNCQVVVVEVVVVVDVGLVVVNVVNL